MLEHGIGYGMFGKMSTRLTPATPLTSPVPQMLLSGDEVVQLRGWASDHVYPLPCAAESRLLIGTTPECEIRVEDPTHRVSRQHACLRRGDARWHIVDQSRNGLFLDKVQQEEGFLVAGMRVGIGPEVTLVAESERTIELRAALARMMGWGADRRAALDQAVQNLRLAAINNRFTICGEGDLLGFVEELHELVMGKQRPLVVCRRGAQGRRSSDDDEGRRVLLATSGQEALQLGRGGTICLDNRRLPEDFTSMREALHDLRSPAQTLVIVLSNYERKTELFTPAPFLIPPLAARKHELDRLIVEYEAIAARKLDLQRLVLGQEQRRWVREASKTLAELQTAILRLGALQGERGVVAGAAKRLRMSYTGLRDWLMTVPTAATRPPRSTWGAPER